MQRITGDRNKRIPSAHIPAHIIRTASRLIRYAALFILLATGVWAQASLKLSSAGAQSGSMMVNIVLSSAAGSEPAALEWTLAYPTANVTQVAFAPGAQATAASKSVTCNSVSGSETCVLEGNNANKILNGVVATATLKLSSSTSGTPTGVLLTQALGASPAATAIPVSTSGSVQIVPVVQSLKCSPSSVAAPGSTTCTVTLSAVPSPGTVVSLGAAATGITVSSPASLTMPSGQTVATYAVSVGAATSSATVNVTASLNGSSASTSFAVTNVSPIRVNAGGPAYQDTTGNLWSADHGYNGGTASSTSTIVSGTSDPVLYQTYRWESGTLQYVFSMPNGTHTVNLKFAETLFTLAGQRVFNIVINGQTVRSALDIFVVAGANKALTLSYPVTVTSGQVVIQLVAVVQNPKINAIEIIP